MLSTGERSRKFCINRTSKTITKKYQIEVGRYLLSFGDRFFFFSAYCLRIPAMKFARRVRSPGSGGVSMKWRAGNTGRIRLAKSSMGNFMGDSAFLEDSWSRSEF